MAPIVCSNLSYNGEQDAATERSNAPSTKVIYAYATDQTNDYGAVRSDVQEALTAMRAKVESASAGTRSLRFDLDLNGCVDVGVVPLTSPVSAYRDPVNGPASAGRVLEELSKRLPALFTSGYKHFLVFAPGLGPGPAGMANSPIDDSPSIANRANRSGLTGVVTWDSKSEGFSDALALVALHELLHTFGVVQRTAPNSDDHGHCDDGGDVMCGFNNGACPIPYTSLATSALDCHGDDYFNIAPSPGSWLASHWNVAIDSLFVCSAWTCDVAQSEPAISLSAGPAIAGQSVTVTASGALAYHWSTGHGFWFGANAPSGNTYTFVAGTSPVTVTARGFAADGAWAERSITITPSDAGGCPSCSGGGTALRPPVAAFTSRVSGTKVTVDASTSYGRPSPITGYSWDLDADGSTDATGKTATFTLGKSARVVRLTVVDGTGQTASIQRAIASASAGGPLAATPSRQKRKTVQSKGIIVKGTGRGKIRLKASVSAATRRKLKLRSRTIATTTVTAKGGRFTVTLRPSATVRRALGRSARIQMTITARDAIKASKTITIIR